MDNEKIIGILKGLIQICRDGAEGFKTCTQDAKDPSLKMYFQDRAHSCEKAHLTLCNELNNYGATENLFGNPAAALHRIFIDLKSALSTNDNLAVLEECERGEVAAVIAYESALREEMPDSLRTLLNEQYEGAKMNHERVRQLRDEARNNPDLA